MFTACSASSCAAAASADMRRDCCVCAVAARCPHLQQMPVRLGRAASAGARRKWLSRSHRSFRPTARRAGRVRCGKAWSAVCGCARAQKGVARGILGSTERSQHLGDFELGSGCPSKRLRAAVIAPLLLEEGRNSSLAITRAITSAFERGGASNSSNSATTY